MMRKLTNLLISLTILAALLIPQQPAAAQPQQPDEAQIRAYLSELVGDQVLDVRITRGSLVIDLAESVLPDGAYNEDTFTQLQLELDLAFEINLFFMTTFLVEGQPLEAWGRPVPDFEHVEDPIGLQELPGGGPLAGVRIALSPGHGLYWNEARSEWRWQRLEYWGIREDTINSVIMRYVAAALLNQGATVIQLRELDFNARTGITGSPAWHEATRQYAIHLGLPDWIHSSGSINYNSDIRARPFMANYYGADLFISLHNNGWNGTLRGTETYWDINNHPGSQALANAVHNSVINHIRAEYDAQWTNRGVKSSDWSYGEIYFANMPAILLELAFMDNEIDNSALQDEAFQLLAARAITRGICSYLGVTCEEVLIKPPQVLEVPNLTPAYNGDMCGTGWHRRTNIRKQHDYLALNAYDQAGSSHIARWEADLPVSGEYRLEAFIPQHGGVNWQCPTLALSRNTHRAVYTITHANGVSHKQVNQAGFADQWVDLGVFHFNPGMRASVSLSDVTGEAGQTATVSASALRVTLVGQAGTLFYNTPWVDQAWIRAGYDAPVDHIRHFLDYHGTCLGGTISDADGEPIDIASLLQQESIANRVNPRVLLAVMESEGKALSQCPNPTALASLMGLSPASTARKQIADAAAKIGTAANALADNGVTPGGWRTGQAKTTQDGVSVTPANDTITVLFDFMQDAGSVWGGTRENTPGVHGLYAAYRDFRLNHSLIIGMNPVFLPLVMR